MYSPMRIENIRFGLCWHQQYQFIARPWPKIIPDAQTDYLQLISLEVWLWIWKQLDFQKYDWNKPPYPTSLLFSPPSCSSGGTQPPFLNHLTKYTHPTTSGKLCNIFLVRHDKIRTTGSKRSLKKASLFLYSSEGKNLETMRHDR